MISLCNPRRRATRSVAIGVCLEGVGTQLQVLRKLLERTRSSEPFQTLHYRAEGLHEYNVLAFVPETKPFDLFEPERAGRMKLYVRRVFITDEAELLPRYLRFVRGLVDSAEARHRWEHSIAAMDVPRWSITFRSLSEKGLRALAA